MVIRKTCLYKYKMNKVKHYPILSHASISLWSNYSSSIWLVNFKDLQLVYLFSSPFISPIYFPYIYIYVTYMLDLILHICISPIYFPYIYIYVTYMLDLILHICNIYI